MNIPEIAQECRALLERCRQRQAPQVQAVAAPCSVPLCWDPFPCDCPACKRQDERGRNELFGGRTDG